MPDTRRSKRRAAKRRRAWRRRALWLGTMIALAALCAGALFWWRANFAFVDGAWRAANTASLTLSGGDWSGVTELRELASLDARACAWRAEDYEAIRAALPNCEIRWNVPLADGLVASDATDIAFSGDPDELARALDFLPRVETVDIRGCEADDEQIYALLSAHPNISFAYTVDVCGDRVDSEATSLDLRGKPIADADALRAALARLPRLESLDLRGIDMTDALFEAIAGLENVRVRWESALYEKAIGDETETLDLSGVAIDDAEALALRFACMPALKRVDMCDCGLSNADMEALMARCPNAKLIWRVKFGVWSMRTDATAFTTDNWADSTTKFDSAEFEPVKYCTDLVALDLGHNRIDDLSFLEGLTKLRILIVADNRISDLRPLEKLQDLEYLEIFQNRIADLRPLSSLHKLKDLNLYANKLDDVTPLCSMTSLERLWLSYNKLGASKRDQLREALPNCALNFTSKAATDDGWRKHPHYYALRAIFDKGAFEGWD